MDELNEGRSGPMHRGGPGRVLTGVCLALARRLRLDVALVRIAFVLALVVSGGSALLAYLLVWFFTPASALGRAPVQRVLGWVHGVTAPEPESRWERRV